MDSVGKRVGAWTLVAVADVPEAGVWWAAARGAEEDPLWVRVAEDEAEGRAVAAVFERYRGLEHALVPRAVGVVPSEGAACFAAPAGVPLSRLLENRHDSSFVMTPATVLAVGEALADLIVVAHERGRPHGHLSPEHIWLTPAGELVVWGFGRGPDQPGDPTWAAPERARGRRASGDTDQWAVAALLCALITGRVPWRSEDPAAEARVGDTAHLWGPVSDQWKPLGRLLERCLSAEPRDRFPSAHPVRQAIAALRQRVRAPDDLPRLGALLADRYGLPGAAAVGAPHAPAPDDVDDAGPPGHTIVTLPEDEAPTEAPDEEAKRPIGMVLADEEAVVRVDADDAPTVVGVDDAPLRGGGGRERGGELNPVEPLRGPASEGAGSSDGTTVWEDVTDGDERSGPQNVRRQPLLEVQNRVRVEEAPPAEPPVFDVRRVASVSVGALALVVLIWLVSGMP